MATLQIEFNCLCMFVRDRAAKAVHVLMPSTEHAGHHADRHLVRLVHPSFGQEPQGRSLLGWALSLGPTEGTADLTLQPARGNGAIANLSAATGIGVDRALVDGPHERIASRVTLRAGRIVRADAERRWLLDGRELSMAHRVVWEMENVSETEPLPWQSLGAAGAAPLRALRDVAPEPGRTADERLYRLRVFHTTPGSLPPNDRAGTLRPEEMARHYAMFYTLLGISSPAAHLLPALVDESRSAAAGGRRAALGAAMGGVLGLAWWRGDRGAVADEVGGALDRRRFVVRSGTVVGGMLLFGHAGEAWAATRGANGTSITVGCAAGGGDLRPGPGTESMPGGKVNCGVGGADVDPAHASAVINLDCPVGGGELRPWPR
ncbi:MAG TPA: hypothetical protein VGB15_19445 [Longimicrobium sp.]|jgi:hypothetical protein